MGSHKIFSLEGKSRSKMFRTTLQCVENRVKDTLELGSLGHEICLKYPQKHLPWLFQKFYDKSAMVD